MGRPRQPPTIKKLVYASGLERFLVRAVILKDDRRRVVKTLEEAKLLAAQWMSDRAEELQVLPTRLSPEKLGQAEALNQILETLKMSFIEAGAWLLRNYKPMSSISWDDAIEQYQTDRRTVGISEAQVTNVRKAALRFKTFIDRPMVGPITKPELTTFLGSLGDSIAASTYNGILGDIGTFLSWLCKKGHLSENPAANFERRKVKRRLPEVLSPEKVKNLLEDLEKNAPGWIPYAALCVFAGLRPGMREGEALRLNNDLVAGKAVFFPGGIQVAGKAHGVRMIPWSACGPLRSWLEVYKPVALWPHASPTAAERDWAKIRERHQLTPDVLRHTAISAMVHSEGASLATVAVAVGNSETMIRKHYLGLWSREMTVQMHQIVPKAFNDSLRRAV